MDPIFNKTKTPAPEREAQPSAGPAPAAAESPAGGGFDNWCLVELFGHQRIVGRVTEAVLAGGAFLRVDVPGSVDGKGFTRFYSPGAIYGISPVSEDIARAMVASNRHEPVSRFELPQLAEKVADNGYHQPEEDDEP